MAKEIFELEALSFETGFEKRHPKWDT